MLIAYILLTDIVSPFSLLQKLLNVRILIFEALVLLFVDIRQNLFNFSCSVAANIQCK